MGVSLSTRAPGYWFQYQIPPLDEPFSKILQFRPCLRSLCVSVVVERRLGRAYLCSVEKAPNPAPTSSTSSSRTGSSGIEPMACVAAVVCSDGTC